MLFKAEKKKVEQIFGQEQITIFNKLMEVMVC